MKPERDNTDLYEELLRIIRDSETLPFTTEVSLPNCYPSHRGKDEKDLLTVSLGLHDEVTGAWFTDRTSFNQYDFTVPQAEELNRTLRIREDKKLSESKAQLIDRLRHF